MLFRKKRIYQISNQNILEELNRVNFYHKNYESLNRKTITNVHHFGLMNKSLKILAEYGLDDSENAFRLVVEYQLPKVVRILLWLTIVIDIGLILAHIIYLVFSASEFKFSTFSEPVIWLYFHAFLAILTFLIFWLAFYSQLNELEKVIKKIIFLNQQ